MGNVVLIRELTEIMKMKNYYSEYLVDKNPPGSIFAAKTPKCMVTAYKSGKVLLQGSAGEDEAKKWGEAPAKKQTIERKKTASGSLPPNFGSLSVLGSDEVGTGDYFGPITVVAAYVKKEDIPLLKELGVRDSKDLNDDKISAIAKQIKDIIPHSLLILHNEKYNQLQQSGMSQGKLKALLHNQALAHVLNKIDPIKPEAILIDQFVQSSTYYQHLKGQKTIVKDDVFFSTKAEGVHIAVAAASILARHAFVQYFEKLSEAAGFKIPKGAGAQVDIAAAKLILAKGRDVLPKFVKLHFANTEKAITLVNKKRG
ncbi:ribonuclease HIII [Neobacillus sp. PS3-40]|uniref:ribonuclease HIII n=1 Tax=Neobacillus sp. PS3-40 TaxID=3070679 RepID=UPI0027DF551C|nr:ribonuclease HIII [Neobacillus sp. PS3-40]WML45604.1 ribonuclease HIII [Neobacillus sp. PS3-40]